MPFVHFKLFGAAVAPHLVTHVQSGLTDLMATVMRKKRSLTVVEVELAGNSKVFCGGELPPARWSGQLTAFVTHGTNTTQEKAAFQAQAYALLRREFGEPSSPVYIIVQDVPATDWGYGGVTQAARAAAPALVESELMTVPCRTQPHPAAADV